MKLRLEKDVVGGGEGLYLCSEALNVSQVWKGWPNHVGLKCSG